jgi:hypothetical protein
VSDKRELHTGMIRWVVPAHHLLLTAYRSPLTAV